MPRKTSNQCILWELRRSYHRQICDSILGHRAGSKVFSIADNSSQPSIALAAGMVKEIGLPTCTDPTSGQTAGAKFVAITAEFLRESFEYLGHLRPAEWIFSTSQGREGISAYAQYQHLRELAELLKVNKELRSSLGGDYIITPDIVLSREPVDDKEINQQVKLVASESQVALDTPLRAANTIPPPNILHASVSCKWTIRSDRVQNTRAEALNLIRNRKGRTPHIVAVTLEPLPSRIASIALGTGDIDCTYHGALYELMRAAEKSKYEDASELLQMMREGDRLRDISDLPFDLAT